MARKLTESLFCQSQILLDSHSPSLASESLSLTTTLFRVSQLLWYTDKFVLPLLQIQYPIMGILICYS